MTQAPPSPAGPLGGADAAEQYVQRRTHEGIAVLTLAGPEGNRLGPDLVKALGQALASAWRDDGVRAVVITARGADFCAGPWTDLPPPGPEPVALPPVIGALADLCSRIEDSPKPVICALHGRVMSGGLALALAARARIADSRARFQFPEPGLGRLPPGNGTVRLCWRVGATEALRLLTARAPLAAPGAMACGLVDQVVTEGLLPAAIQLAEGLAVAAAARPVATGLADPQAYRAAVSQAREALPQPLPAQRAHEALMLDCVEAALLLPQDQALGFDLVRAEDAALAPVARALAHLARATRRGLLTPEGAAGGGDGPVRSTPMAIAMARENAARLIPEVLRSGVRVVLLAPDRAPLTDALEATAETQLAMVRAGRLTQAQSEADWNQVTGRLQLDPEQPPALGLADHEHAVWLDAELPAETTLLIWSPGSPALPPLSRLGRVVALVPAPSRAPRLCEIVVQPGTAPETVRQAMQVALRLKLTPIRVAGAPIVPRLSQAAAQAAHRLRVLGVTSATLRAAGILPNGAELGDAAETAEPLPLSAERLIVLAVINAGARMLTEGQVLRASDIDLAMVLGAGWPNWRGGPMAEGDAIGPMVLRHELRQAEGLDPELWTPAPLFDQMIRDGQNFETLRS